jgi:hypothetical protein
MSIEGIEPSDAVRPIHGSLKVRLTLMTLRRGAKIASRIAMARATWFAAAGTGPQQYQAKPGKTQQQAAIRARRLGRRIRQGPAKPGEHLAGS